MKFTDATIGTTACPPGRKDALLFDEALKGFGLRVTSSGKKVFIFQYRTGAKVRRTVLGTWGAELSAAQARKKAEALRGQVLDARDPVSERKAAKAETAAAEARAKAALTAAAYTVDTLIQQWTDHHLIGRSESYRKRVPADLRRALKTWRHTPASAFARVDAVRALDMHKIESGPIAANRLRAEARACWGWGVKRGAIEGNPWSATPQPSREKSRERVLTDDEIGALWRTAATLKAPWTGILHLMILTGQRRSEVAGMRWDEIDATKAKWTLPGSRTKNGRTHVVPLSVEALAILTKATRVKDAELVFQGIAKTAPSGFGKVKARLDPALTKVAADAGKPVQAWTLHDIRRTVATGLQQLGVRLEVTEAVLNHVSGSRSGIVGVYQRHGWEKEKVEALKGWAAHVVQHSSPERRPGENGVPSRGTTSAKQSTIAKT